ncbi:hypothetical protein NOR_03982 [Metarhizium rileyi]|uniref:Uncharacterized protein n=1 Tax=Metarhizium rileyi (strain RCEF 4871) TaxID=1649241 RepID=A0A167EPQ8_METRR|nr:hypothetical protein NOR_03982 [Metarhizium rileyi RCEF 4871]
MSNSWLSAGSGLRVVLRSRRLDGQEARPGLRETHIDETFETNEHVVDARQQVMNVKPARRGADDATLPKVRSTRVPRKLSVPSASGRVPRYLAGGDLE